MGNRYLYAGFAGFVAGIFFRSFFDFGLAFTSFVAVIAVAVFVLGRIEDFHQGRTLGTGKGSTFGNQSVISLFIFVAALGMFRYDLSELHKYNPFLERSLGKEVTLRGIISDEADERESSSRLAVTLDSAVLEKEEISITGKILVITNLYPKWQYGDRLELFGFIAKPKNFSDETTLREVDYRAYLAKDGIYYEMFRPRVTLLSGGQGSWLVEKLFAFKGAFIGNTSRLIPEPHAALLGGLVVGAKQSLGKKLLDDFRTVGVIHIVVLSGYNITIIAYFIEWLFSRFRKSLRLILASVGIVLFAVMVGASATVVRATIMALLVLLARSTGRIYAVTRALLIAGFFMLLHNPKILVFDTSFQLSFLATVGLIYFSPLIEPKVKWITEKWKLREIVVATISTQIFVLPFLLYKTGLFSVVSLPVNLLILTAIPATMLLGFLAGISAFVSTMLALPFAYGAYALLAYELGVVEWFARLPFASITLAAFPSWLVILVYLFYFVIYLRLRPRSVHQFQHL
ncbi:MAG: ComEC/Rec2-related protein [Parcubacteria group bacterium GW2011_GWA2_47_16]|nr:MAG: ComEC/Rec2-related protein [Parcubacteria group bacterium GW2011_GWA2_47_16]